MTDAPSAKRYDWGSSLSIIFNPEFDKVIIGFSRDDTIYKFPCGKIEEADFGGDLTRPIEEVARICAIRELGNETHEDVIEHLDLDSFYKLRYVRTFMKRQDDGSKMPLAQYHFIGQLKKRVDFWSPPAESSEMEIPEWWTPYDVLRLDHTHDRKINPIHQIAFAAGLRELRAMFRVGEMPQLDTVFARIARIPLMRREGMSEHDVPTTDIFGYEEALWALIKSRQI